MASGTRIALLCATCLLSVVSAGCTDTTVEPKSSITEANVFNDPGSYRSFIARVYAGLAVSGQQGPAGQPDIQGIDEGFSQYLRLYWTAQELPTDAAIIAWNDVGLPEMNTQLWAASNGFVVSLYYRIFFQVGMANEFLRQTSDDVLSARGVSDDLRAQIQQYRAEARFLRALSYWHGVDFFGNIPLLTEADALGATPPEQSTRQEIFDFVVQELTEIRSSLPQAGPSTYGRANSVAASMLLAKLYLNAEVYTGSPRWGDALAATEAVISSPFRLDDQYRDIFLADNNNSPEIIFPVPQDGLRTQTFGGMTFIIHASVGGNMDAGAYGIDGGWWGLRMKPQTFNLFEPGDGRASYFFTAGQSVDVPNVGDFFAGIPAPKFSNLTSGGLRGSHATHVDTDFPMFRLTDAYLMYAEAVLRGGGGSRGQALTYVNAIRERAFGGPAGRITDEEMTLDFLIDERGRELLWEAHRRTDLIRFGLFTGGDYLWAWKGGSAQGAATAAFRDLYPLPASELVANPNLQQNTGY